jgi:hypothetical protein
MLRTLRRTLALAALTTAAAHAQYLPVGVQQNVAIATILGGGWTQCYAATMATALGRNAQTVRNACSGDRLMMAGRETGSSTLLLAAQASFAEVFTITAQSANATNLFNGAQWYFNPNDWSWGFAEAGATTFQKQCDVNVGALRMCLHTFDGVGGYRIGDVQGLNDSQAYEKVFFTYSANANVVPEPSTYALMATGLAGLGAVARRQRARAA